MRSRRAFNSCYFLIILQPQKIEYLAIVSFMYSFHCLSLNFDNSKVLENEQYKNIARTVYKAPGTIRNRLNKIYDILGVMDRMGFISTYLGYEIVFEKSNDIE